MATAADILATAPPARKSETGDKPPAPKVQDCKCATTPKGERGTCTALTKKSFAQGHDARMSSRVATEIATGRITEAEGVAAIRKAGGGEQLVSKTVWSANLRAKKLEAKNKPQDHKPKAAAKPKAAKPTTKVDESEVHDPESEDLDAGGTVKIKIGRWTYDASISDNGDADYTNSRGEAMKAVKGSYTLVK